MNRILVSFITILLFSSVIHAALERVHFDASKEGFYEITEAEDSRSKFYPPNIVIVQISNIKDDAGNKLIRFMVHTRRKVYADFSAGKFIGYDEFNLENVNDSKYLTKSKEAVTSNELDYERYFGLFIADVRSASFKGPHLRLEAPDRKMIFKLTKVEY